MKSLCQLAAMLLLLAGVLEAAGPVFRTNDIPRASELRKDLSWDTRDKELRDKILKLIPLGTPEEDAKLLFQKHMPPKPQEAFNVGGVAQALPQRLRENPYTCFRVLHEFHPMHLSSQWIEVLFFFDDGKLIEVFVARGGVSA